MRFMGWTQVLCAVTLLLALRMACAADEDAALMPSASLHEQVLTIQIDPYTPVDLQATLFQPPGPGPFPLVVLNHGSSEKPGHEQTRSRISYAADYFVSRGYAVLMPMMRGYAGSSGHQVPVNCELANLAIANGRDILLTIDYASTLPQIDTRRVVVAGQSFGGWNTLGVGALHDPRVVALINFNGGVVYSACRDSQNRLSEESAKLAQGGSVPSLWFYGDNDTLFDRETWDALYKSYVWAGGQAEVVDFGHFFDDSHNVLGMEEGLALWVPKVDEFLARNGLPAKVLFPEYLPTPVPPPSHYASVDDFSSVPYLQARDQSSYQSFLQCKPPRALVIASDGAMMWASGGFDPLGRALAACGRRASHGHCEPYAFDNDVVWQHAGDVPAPSHFAELGDSTAVPYLNEEGRNAYRGFLAMHKPRAFVVAPNGGWAASSRGTDPLHEAMQRCSQQHSACHFYAIDDDVVWSTK